MTSIRRLTFALALLTLAASSALADDWPQWRGPTRDGVATGVTLPDRLPAEFKPVWQFEVGEGHSSPVLSGGKMVVFAREDDDEILRCFDLQTVKELWRVKTPVAYQPQAVAKAHGEGPFSTPTIADGKVYAFGITGLLTCCDLATGKVLWKKDFVGEFKKTYPTWGAACSPLVEGNLCILSVGTRTEGGLAAFETATGNRAWLMNQDGAAYSSPVAADIAGRRQAVTLLDSNAVGVEVKTGKLLWKSPFRVQYEQNVVTPLVSGDLVAVSGWGQSTVGLRIAGAGDNLTASQAWKNDEDGMYLTSPVRSGDYLYGLSARQGGTLVCLSVKDGKAAWSSPGKVGDYVSIVRAGERLLVMTTKGELLLVAADPSGYKELGRTRVTERPVWAHLTVVGRRLFVKDETHLTCVELP
jgi:outer membrane protein assembly factor BamB